MSIINRDERILNLTEELFDLQEEHESGETYLPSKFLRELAVRVVEAEMEVERLRAGASSR